jgi:PEP-CTERM motif
MARRLILALALVGASAAGANATVISGSFNISGNMTATATSVSWASSTAVANQATIGLSPTGSFASLATTSVTIDNLNLATEPVGSTFAAQSFLTFLSPLASSFPNLMIDDIAAGIGTATACTEAPASGQVCTPTGSMFTFVNGPGGSSSLSFGLSGMTSDGKSSWTGAFTAQFNAPYQTILSDFAAAGSFSTSYSATIDVTAERQTGVPEPLTLSLFGAGLAGAAAMRRRKAR